MLPDAYPCFPEELTCAEQTGAHVEVAEVVRRQEATKMLNHFANVLGLAKKSSTIFQVFSDLLKSNCSLPLRTFPSKYFMLVYFKKNIGLVFSVYLHLDH